MGWGHWRIEAEEEEEEVEEDILGLVVGVGLVLRVGMLCGKKLLRFFMGGRGID